MRAPVSILIPTLNDCDRLGPLFSTLAEGLSEGLIAEVILADGGSRDGIEAVAEAAGARLVTAPPGRGGQLAAGAGEARGDWLLILHGDSRLDPGWSRAVLGHLAAGDGKAGWFRLRFDVRGAMPTLVAGWANLRARAFALPYGDQGLLIRRAVLEDLGGIPEIPLMEDVALARRLGRSRLGPLNHGIETSADRYRRDGWIRRGAGNLLLLTRYLAGADPRALARRYRSGHCPPPEKP